MNSETNLAFSANKNCLAYKILETLEKNQVFVTLKTFNFLLSCNEQEIGLFLKYRLTHKQLLISIVSNAANYNSNGDKDILKRMENEYDYEYPNFTKEKIEDFYPRNVLKNENLFTSAMLDNMKKYFSYVEVPTVYVTLKGLVTLNFDIDRHEGINATYLTKNPFAEVIKTIDSSVFEHIHTLASYKIKLLVVEKLL